MMEDDEEEHEYITILYLRVVKLTHRNNNIITGRGEMLYFISDNKLLLTLLI